MNKNSVDNTPWQHPFLQAENIRKFREYSEKVWLFASNYEKESNKKLNCAFVVNMAQNMYKWACLSQKYGTQATLYNHPLDNSTINLPQWEEYAGEWNQLNDIPAFLANLPEQELRVSTVTIPMGDSGMHQSFNDSQKLDCWHNWHQQIESTQMYPEVAISHPGCYPYWDWARGLEKHDVIYTCSVPIAAYLSGRPYCFFSVGGDLQYDCGRGDDYGFTMRLAVNRARFILVSNPHTLAHCRRLGFRNAVYLPYPMDTDRYCPGAGMARNEWVARFGGEVYILITSRVDMDVKGHDEDYFAAIITVARQSEQARFIFLGWGNDLELLRNRVILEGLQNQIIILSPVGKMRLIDYYRSCDAVLDQFVYGYYGATMLEAASIGKPVIMKMRAEQYNPLYAGDVAPVENANTPAAMRDALLNLIDRPDYRLQKSKDMRDWLVRNHGEEKTVPLMLAMLRLAADCVPLPADLVNPLSAHVTDVESAYHQACLKSSI